MIQFTIITYGLQKAILPHHTLTCDFISIYNRPITDIVTSVNMTECKYRDCCLLLFLLFISTFNSFMSFQIL